MDKLKYFDLSDINGKVQKVVAAATAEALKSFCVQEAEFEQAIEQSGKTFKECLDEITKDISAGNSGISDIEIYRRAVKFYFSTATVNFTMRIELSGNNGGASTILNSLSVSLDDLLNF